VPALFPYEQLSASTLYLIDMQVKSSGIGLKIEDIKQSIGL
jgi:hypothetical protein